MTSQDNTLLETTVRQKGPHIASARPSSNIGGDTRRRCSARMPAANSAVVLAGVTDGSVDGTGRPPFMASQGFSEISRPSVAANPAGQGFFRSAARTWAIRSSPAGSRWLRGEQ